MELVDMLFDFFGFEMISSSATLPELIVWLSKVGIGVFLVLSVIRGLFISTRLPSMKI